MADQPAWLSQGAPQGATQPLARFHYPLVFTLVGQEAGTPPTVTTDTPLDDMSAADLAYMEKVRHFVAAQQRGVRQQRHGQISRPDSQPLPVGTMPTGRVCDLCEMAQYTQWYAEFYVPFRFTILDCDSCEVPIAVLGEHRVDMRPEEIACMEAALNLVAEHKYSGKFPKWMFDHHMRQIPDHYHFHVRPLLW